MTSTLQPGQPAEGRVPAPLTPLHPDDPPRLGDFWLDARVAATASGVGYVGHDAAGQALVVVLSEGAASDAAARERLAGTVNKMHIDTVVARGGQGQDSGRLGHRFRAQADAPQGDATLPLAPWVALAYDGSLDAVQEARRILAEVDLSWLPTQGRPVGPDYEHYWIEQGRPGTWRLWPLPWPGRNDRAGWLSILASWLLMLLIMCLAVLIAILLFQNAPQQQPPPPVPTSASGSGSGSPSSSSPSGSPSSGSASPSMSASPTPSGSGSPSGGSPSPNSRL